MSQRPDLTPNPHEPFVYAIRVHGHLDRQWADWFSGLQITLEESGETLLTGPVSDQAALYGLLRTMRDLGMSLISVNRMGSTRGDASDSIARPEPSQREQR